MEIEDAVDVLSALAQPTRLDVFRLLVMHEPDGLAAGDVAPWLGVPHNTMSTHLSILTRAGLVKGQRDSRSIIYRADLDQFRKLMVFLLQDCCGGDGSFARPYAILTTCCPPKEKAHD